HEHRASSTLSCSRVPFHRCGLESRLSAPRPPTSSGAAPGRTATLGSRPAVPARPPSAAGSPATCTSLQSPPRAVLTPRAVRARAMPRMLLTPLAWISLMKGRTLAARASAISVACPARLDACCATIRPDDLKATKSTTKVTGAAFIGPVGLDWQLAGIGPVHGAGESDPVLRNKNSGAFEDSEQFRSAPRT